MRLIYLSTDELNQALVRIWAAQEGVHVECPGRADRTVTGPDSAILLDMDHPPQGWLEAVLTRLAAAGGAPAVAAHGYGPYLDDLRSRGLTVHPRLGSRVLADLASSAMSTDPSPVPDDSDALTWINLA
jgi:hypothetical protein